MVEIGRRWMQECGMRESPADPTDIVPQGDLPAIDVLGFGGRDPNSAS